LGSYFNSLKIYKSKKHKFNTEIGTKQIVNALRICSPKTVKSHVRWVGPLSPQHGVSSSCGWKEGLWLWCTAVNTMSKHLWTNGNRQSSSMGVGHEAYTIKISVLQK
jgi:hypothetical protein